MTRLRVLTAALAVTLIGCGGSSPSSSSPSSSTVASNPTAPPAATTTSSAANTTTAARHHHAPVPTTTTTTTSSTPIATAPPPTPSGTPPAPDGLAQTTGYSMYELCSSHCQGTVPASLRRPLHPPNGCPVGGRAPIMPDATGTLHLMKFTGSSWGGANVNWSDAAGYAGPILIRGRELGGSHAVGFGEGHVPYDELQLYAPSAGAHKWPSFVRVRGQGCYAYQVDTTRGSSVIVFRAAG
jgi:hypothetical protein